MFTLEETQRRNRNTAIPFFNLGARRGVWSTPRPGRLALGKGTWHLLYTRLVGSQERCGLVRKIFPLL
jgi:hypothetical protein